MQLIALPKLSPAQHALVRMQNLHRDSLLQLANACRTAFNELWRNPQATPAEMAAALGTNAAACFAAHATTVAFILAADASLLAPEDYTPPQAYTFNQDGSINLSS